MVLSTFSQEDIQIIMYLKRYITSYMQFKDMMSYHLKHKMTPELKKTITKLLLTWREIRTCITVGRNVKMAEYYHFSKSGSFSTVTILPILLR